MTPAMENTLNQLWARVHRQAVLRGRGEANERLDRSIRVLEDSLLRQGMSPIELRLETDRARESAQTLERLYLKPNKPTNRLKHVIKQYLGTPRQTILLDTILVTLNLVGQDHAVGAMSMLTDAIRKPVEFWGGHRPTAEEQAKFERDFDTMVTAQVEKRLPAHNDLDFMIPWVARELGRLHKAVDKSAKRHDAEMAGWNRHRERFQEEDWIERAEEAGDPVPADYYGAVSSLMAKAPVIGMWAEANGVDMSKLSLVEALEAVKTWERERDDAGAVPGTIVMEFEDGYSIQALTTDSELESEGDAMGNCVGGYCDQVRTGRSLIYSLRDPRGMPHVTIEVRPRFRSKEWIDAQLSMERAGRGGLEDPVRFLASPLTQFVDFQQIRGKQNEMPVEKYRPYVQAFINEYFHGNRLGLLMVAMPGQMIDFRGAEIEDINTNDDWAWRGTLFENGNYAGATFRNCVLGNEFFDGVSFKGAKFINSRVEEVFNANFDDTIWVQKRRSRRYARRAGIGDRLIDCTFRNAVFRPAEPPTQEDLIRETEGGGRTNLGPSLSSESLTRCDFTSAELTDCQVRIVMDGGSLEDVVMEGCAIHLLHLTRVDVEGLTIDSSNHVYSAYFEGMDLRRLDKQTAALLFTAAGDEARYEQNKWATDVLYEEGALSPEEYERWQQIEGKGLDPYKPLSEMTPEEVRRYLESQR